MQANDYLLMAPTREILPRGRIPHNATGLQELAARIEQHAGPDRNIRVGIEMNDGALLAWLIEKGYTVFGIQPKSVRRAREIYRPGGGKDDPVDTFVLAEMARLSASGGGHLGAAAAGRNAAARPADHLEALTNTCTTAGLCAE